MITRRMQENIAILLLLAFFITAVVMSLDYSPRARLVPIPISCLAIVLLVFQLVWQNIRPADELNVDLLDVLTERGQNPDAAAGESDEPPSAAEEAASEATQWKRIIVSLGFVALFVTMILLGGPIPALFVFTAGYFVLSGHFSIGRALAYTAVFTAAVYLVFVQALQLQLYHGYLEPVAEFLRRL